MLLELLFNIDHRKAKILKPYRTKSAANGCYKVKVTKIKKLLNFIAFAPTFILLSAFIKPIKARRKIVGFASAYFSGNVKYLYLEMMRNPNFKTFFVSGEKNEIERIKKIGVDAHYYMDFKSIPLFLRTHAWITSHGTNYIPFFGIVRRILPFWRWKHGSRWIDVWHGIAWVHTQRGKMLRDYDLAIVTSEFFKRYYSAGDSSVAAKIKITGYPRNDPLMERKWSEEEIRKKIGIPINRKSVLYAPTWGHKRKKGLFLWGDSITFLKEMERFCEENMCNFLVRMHPNWYKQEAEQKRILETELKKAEWIFHVPPYKYVDVQPLLYISQVLITDWSSIANDFILLNRPIIFLDVELPVKKFVLGPEDRAGYIVRNKEEFFEKLKEALETPNLFESERKRVIKKIHKYLDGNSSKRCIKEILKLLKESF